MKTLLSGLMAATLAASFAMPLPMSAEAAPVYVPRAEQGQTDVQNVNHTYRHWRRQQWAERRAYRNWRRQAWRDRDRYYYRGDRAFRPHRYYRYYDEPYRYRHHRQPGVTLEFNL